MAQALNDPEQSTGTQQKQKQASVDVELQMKGLESQKVVNDISGPRAVGSGVSSITVAFVNM